MNTTHIKPEPVLMGTYILPGEYCDWDAQIVNNGSLYYPLTECCSATATGSMGETCCRNCYEEVDSIFGICWTESEWQTRAPQMVQS